ncbi:MAG: hypothetical protein HC907_37160 [Richelia sp. SM1_7_0]|nr:hypothetical protein [Richelia sp. SM1_7_0]
MGVPPVQFKGGRALYGRAVISIVEVQRMVATKALNHQNHNIICSL